MTGSARREQNEARARRGRENPQLIPHGASGYVNWLCRCDTCSEANRERNRLQREARKRRTSQQSELVPHGLGGYTNYGCRCDVCTSAHAADCHKRRTSSRQADLAHRADLIEHGTPNDLYAP